MTALWLALLLGAPQVVWTQEPPQREAPGNPAEHLPVANAEMEARTRAFMDEAYKLEAAGHRPEALRLYLEGVAYTRKAWGPDHAWTALLEAHAANAHANMGTIMEGWPLMEHALPVLQKTYGQDKVPRFQCVHGYLQSLASDPEAGMAEMEHALDLLRKDPSVLPGVEVELVIHMAMACHLLRDWKRTQTAARRSIELTTAAQGADSFDTLYLKKLLADGLYGDLQTPAARALYEEVVPKLRKLSPVDKSLLGTAYQSMLGTYSFYTEKAAQNVVRKDGETYADEHLNSPAAPWQVHLLWNLAVLHANDRDLGKARLRYQQAEKVARQLGDRRLLLKPLHGLAYCDYQEGRSAQAVSLHIELIQMAEEFKEQELDFLASVECDLASIYSEMKDSVKALPHARRALELSRRSPSKDASLLLRPINQLGSLEYYAGDTAAALRVLKEGAELTEKFFVTCPTDSLEIIDTLAYLLRKTGATRQALNELDRVIPMGVKLLGADHDSMASLYANRSFCCRDECQYEAAVVEAEKALGIKQRTSQGRWNGMENDYRNLLAFCHWYLGHADTARELARESVPSNLARFHQQLGFTAENQRRALVVNMGVVDVPANFGMAEETARIILNMKGMVTESLMRDLRAASQSDDAQVKEALKVQKNAREDLRKTALETHSTSSTSALLTAAQERLELAEQRLFTLLKRGTPELIEPEAVTAALPPDAALLDWFHYRWHPKEQGSHVAYGLVVYRPGKKPAFHHLGKVPDIDASLLKFFLALRSTQASLLEMAVGKAPGSQVEEAAGEILTRLLGDAAASLEGVKTLYFSPDETLQLVPFAILPDAHGRLLGERFALRRLASARDILRQPTKVGNTAVVDVFADPAFASPGTGMTKSTDKNSASDKHSLPRLPGARQEAKALEKMALAAGLKCQVALGAGATEPALRALRSPGILHLGTHGYYHSGPDEDAAVDQVYSGLNFSLVSRGDHPMERSGIALAIRGAGEGRSAGPSLGDDGRLSASEAAELELDGTWLVSIGACTSALGSLRSGDGVASIQNGFLVAGARHVLAPLWPVNDKLTAEFMKDFYQDIFAGKSAPDALLATQMRRFRASEKEVGYHLAAIALGGWIMVSRER